MLWCGVVCDVWVSCRHPVGSDAGQQQWCNAVVEWGRPARGHPQQRGQGHVEDLPGLSGVGFRVVRRTVGFCVASVGAAANCSADCPTTLSHSRAEHCSLCGWACLWSALGAGTGTGQVDCHAYAGARRTGCCSHAYVSLCACVCSSGCRTLTTR